MNKWINEGINEWINEGMNEWINEGMNEGMNEWMDEWVWVREGKKNEWMDGICVHFRLRRKLSVERSLSEDISKNEFNNVPSVYQISWKTHTCLLNKHFNKAQYVWNFT